jgi:hypothetical protein
MLTRRYANITTVYNAIACITIMWEHLNNTRCASCVEGGLANNLHKECDAVANNLCDRLRNQCAVAILKPVFCETGSDTDNKGARGFINTKQCGATEPGGIRCLREAQLQLTEDSSPNVSLIHVSLPPNKLANTPLA